jgi:DNA-directed RNA polymerase subunit RPC12/RpoP
MFCLFSNLSGWPGLALTLFVVGLVIALGVLVSTSNQRRRQSGVQCPHCGHANPVQARYCARCGRKLTPP